MDQREHHLQSWNVCHRLFNFIVRSLTSQALKTVTLGRLPPMNRGLIPGVHSSEAGNDGAESKNDHPDPATVAQGSPCEAALSGANVELDEQGNTSKNLEPFGLHGEELPPVQGSGDDVMSSPQISRDNSDCLLDSGKINPEEEAPLSTTTAPRRAPRKTVSINDVVEEMSTPKKNKKQSKAFSKSTSIGSEEDDPRPLRSILKVGSSLHEISDTFWSRATEGR